MRTYIMRRQRIDFRDTCREGYKRGADRAAAADDIAVFVGFPHEFLRDNIHDGKTVTDDGRQFFFQSFFHHCGKRFSVNLMCPVVTNPTQLLIRILDDGRTFIGTNG